MVKEQPWFTRYKNLRQKKREIEKERRKKALYNKSFSGKLGKKIVKGFTIPQQGITKSLYGRKYKDLKDKTVSGVKQNGRGRPKGSYDKRYARFGGVYGYRKWLRTQLKIKRLQAERESKISPQQAQVLRQFQMKRQQQMMSPESQTIPDTYGNVPLKGIMDEINSFSNLVS